MVDLPTLAPLPAHPTSPWNIIPLGVGVDGEVTWNTSTQAQLLITGADWSGKREVEKTVRAHLKRHSDKWDIYKANPYANYHTIRENVTISIAAIKEVVALMVQRTKLVVTAGVKRIEDLPNPPKNVMLFINEPDVIFSEISKPNHSFSDDVTTLDIQTAIENLILCGRSAGIHVVIRAQRFTVRSLSCVARENIAAKYFCGPEMTLLSRIVLCGGVSNQDGIERIPGRGAFVVDSHTQRVQGYLTTLPAAA